MTCDMVMAGSLEALTSYRRNTVGHTCPRREDGRFRSSGERRPRGPAGALEAPLPVVEFPRNSFQAASLTAGLQLENSHGEIPRFLFTAHAHLESMFKSPRGFCRTSFLFHGCLTSERPALLSAAFR